MSRRASGSWGNVAHMNTQKPVELCEYLIKTYTNPGELVVDICAGSGTTAVAAVGKEQHRALRLDRPAHRLPQLREGQGHIPIVAGRAVGRVGQEHID